MHTLLIKKNPKPDLQRDEYSAIAVLLTAKQWRSQSHGEAHIWKDSITAGKL